MLFATMLFDRFLLEREIKKTKKKEDKQPKLPIKKITNDHVFVSILILVRITKTPNMNSLFSLYFQASLKCLGVDWMLRQ